MRDVNSGWLLRYTHANVASFFFLFLYFHTARGFYYSSYRTPRALVWTIGVIILILTMATSESFLNIYIREIYFWPNCQLIDDLNITPTDFYGLTILPFSKNRVKSNLRIGPHNIDILSLLVCGMLGDWWAIKQKNNKYDSVIFYIEQTSHLSGNTAYIHYLNELLYDLGYCSSVIPKLVKKSGGFMGKQTYNQKPRFNYRLTLLSFTSLIWIYDSFYILNNQSGVSHNNTEEEPINPKKKVIPFWISQYITPLGLAHWIMQDGSLSVGQGINIATNSFTYDECLFLANILNSKYSLTTSVIKSGLENQWRLSIWKRSMPLLVEIVKPYLIPEMEYKFKGYI